MIYVAFWFEETLPSSDGSGALKCAPLPEEDWPARVGREGGRMVSVEVESVLEKLRHSITAVATSFDSRAEKLQQGLEAMWLQRLAEISRAQQEAIAAV